MTGLRQVVDNGDDGGGEEEMDLESPGEEDACPSPWIFTPGLVHKKGNKKESVLMSPSPFGSPVKEKGKMTSKADDVPNEILSPSPQNNHAPPSTKTIIKVQKKKSPNDVSTTSPRKIVPATPRKRRGKKVIKTITIESSPEPEKMDEDPPAPQATTGIIKTVTASCEVHSPSPKRNIEAAFIQRDDRAAEVMDIDTVVSKRRRNSDSDVESSRVEKKRKENSGAGAMGDGMRSANNMQERQGFPTPDITLVDCPSKKLSAEPHYNRDDARKAPNFAKEMMKQVSIKEASSGNNISLDFSPSGHKEPCLEWKFQGSRLRESRDGPAALSKEEVQPNTTQPDPKSLLDARHGATASASLGLTNNTLPNDPFFQQPRPLSNPQGQGLDPPRHEEVQSSHDRLNCPPQQPPLPSQQNQPLGPPHQDLPPNAKPGTQPQPRASQSNNPQKLNVKYLVIELTQRANGQVMQRAMPVTRCRNSSGERIFVPIRTPAPSPTHAPSQISRNPNMNKRQPPSQGINLHQQQKQQGAENHDCQEIPADIFYAHMQQPQRRGLFAGFQPLLPPLFNMNQNFNQRGGQEQQGFGVNHQMQQAQAQNPFSGSRQPQPGNRNQTSHQVNPPNPIFRGHQPPSTTNNNISLFNGHGWYPVFPDHIAGPPPSRNSGPDVRAASDPSAMGFYHAGPPRLPNNLQKTQERRDSFNHVTQSHPQPMSQQPQQGSRGKSQTRPAATNTSTSEAPAPAPAPTPAPPQNSENATAAANASISLTAAAKANIPASRPLWRSIQAKPQAVSSSSCSSSSSSTSPPPPRSKTAATSNQTLVKSTQKATSNTSVMTTSKSAPALHLRFSGATIEKSK